MENFSSKVQLRLGSTLKKSQKMLEHGDTSEYNRDVPKGASQSSSRGGRFELTPDESLEARVQAMVTNQFNSLSLKGAVKSATMKEACNICDKSDHSIADCPTIPLMKDMMHDNMSEASLVFSNQFGGGSQGSNANWRATNTQQSQGASSQQGNQYYRHPNSTQSQGGGSYQGRRNEPNVDQQIQLYQPPQYLYAQLLQMQQNQFQQMHAANQAAIAQRQQAFQALQQQQQAFQTSQQQAFQAAQQQQNQALNEKFASFAARWEKGKFPSQTTPNPNTPSNSNPKNENLRGCQAVTTLRSGTTYKNQEHILDDSNVENEQMVEPEQVQPEAEVVGDKEQPLEEVRERPKKRSIFEEQRKEQQRLAQLYGLPPPFPQAFTPPPSAKDKDKLQRDVFETLSKCIVNVHLIDAIKQILAYAKFLKELCTVKHPWHVRKDTFATEYVSASVQDFAPTKCSDPGTPLTTCTIGDKSIERALLDLGSSVNILTYPLFAQLGLDNPKPTRMVLQLADRSKTYPRGIVEDVLVKIGNFCYPADFVIMDVQGPSTSNLSSIILGRPFLSTCNALINCRNGSLKMSFGNLTIDLNIFDVYRKPLGEEEVEEICMIFALAE